MTENAFFELLKEVRFICEMNEIEYFLGGKILYFAMFPGQEIPEDFQDMEVLMDGKNAKKFIKACEKLPENRILEHPLRNKKFRNLDIYYINKESTCIDFKALDRREFLGISIPIRIIQPIQKGSRLKLTNKIEKLWRTNYSYHYLFDRGSEMYEKAYPIFFGLDKNGDRVTTMVFQKLLDTSLQGNEKSCRLYTKKKRKKYSANLFRDKIQVSIKEQKFWTVNNIPKYMEETYGENWLDLIFVREISYINVKEADVEYEKQLFENDEFWNRLQKSRRIRQINVISNNIYNRNWRMVLCIYQGVLLQDKLLKKMDILKKMLEQGDFSGIIATMANYKKVLDMNRIYHVKIDESLHQIYEQAKSEVSRA